MRYILKGNFNPINSDQLAYIDILCKRKNLNEIYLLNSGKKDFFDISIKEYPFLKAIEKKAINKNETIENSSTDLEINYLDGDFTKFNKAFVDYVFNNPKYLELIVKNKLSKRRYEHSVSVAKTAVIIAKYNNLDQNEAYISGLLHDISKEFDRNYEKLIMERYFKDATKLNRKIFHQYTGYYFVKEIMRCDNYNILDAILHHVNGTSNTPLAMAIFIADKIEPLRGYDTSKEEALYRQSLKDCFNYVKATQVRYLNENLKVKQ